MHSFPQDPELTLLELEDRLLLLVDQAWEAYDKNGAGFPPSLLVNLMEKVHRMIAGRLEKKLGKGFDMERPEATLIMIKRIEDMLLKKLEQKERMRVAS